MILFFEEKYIDSDIKLYKNYSVESSFDICYKKIGKESPKEDKKYGKIYTSKRYLPW